MSFKKERGNWAATIWVNQRSHHVGYFSNELEAALAYDK